MIYTPTLRHTLYTEALNYIDRDAYISDLASSPIWPDDPGDLLPAERIALLGDIYDDTHCTLPNLLSRYHLTQTAFSRYFSIPLRTVQHWYLGERQCPPYLLTMAAEILRLTHT